MIDISGLDKVKLLRKLFKASRKLNVNVPPFLRALTGDQDLPEDDARTALAGGYIDYLNATMIECDLSGDTFQPGGFDRACGQGAAQRVVDELRAESKGL
jgi:hypothetical protein